MSVADVEHMGPVLLVSRDRAVIDRVRALLVAERFELVHARGTVAALDQALARQPTVVLVDWSLDDDPSREELVYRLRPRRTGPRVLVIAGRDGAEPASVSAVRAVLSRTLDAEELVDLVWRHHHEVVDARGTE